LNGRRKTASRGELGQSRPSQDELGADAGHAASVEARLVALECEAVNAEETLMRLYKLIEDGVAQMDDLLKERITALKAERDRSKEALARARGNVKARAEVTEEAVAKFSELMRQCIQQGDTLARKAWVASIVGCKEDYDQKIRICSRKDVLEQAVMANGGPVPGVRCFVRRWRARKDSNL
jgi:hypothetical protein